MKHFAKYRMISNGQMRASGLQDYLVLLSIYQTCVYKKVSFLRFLLSSERDIDAFAQAGRKRPRATVRRPDTSGQPALEGETSGESAAPADPGTGEPRASCPGLGEPVTAGQGLEVEAAIEGIVRKVVAGEDDPRLKWSRGRRRVRVLIESAFHDRRVRGPSLHGALEAHLKAEGWSWAHNAVLHTYERSGPSGG